MLFLFKKRRFSSHFPRWLPFFIRRIFLGFIALGFFLPDVIWAVTPRVEWGITTRLLYTDNVSLSNEDKRSDGVMNIRPSVQLTGKGARLELNLAYAPSIDLHTDASQENGIGHFLDFDSTAELLRNRLFLDVAADARLVNILRDRARDDLGVSSSGTTQSYSYQITPRFVQRLGPYASIDGQLRFRDIRFIDRESSNLKTTSVNLNLLETRLSSRVDGNLSFAYESTDRVDRDDFYTSSFTAGLRYRYDVYWRFTADAGYEKNSFIVRRGTEPQGVLWHVGAIWTPSSRVQANVSVGRRFFGSDYALDLRYRHRHSVVTASYVTSYETGGGVIGLDDNFPRVDAFGNPIDNPVSNGPNDNGAPTPSISSEVFKRDRFSLSWAVSGRRHGFELSAYYEQREFEESDRNEHDRGVRLGLTHNLSARTHLFGRANWDTLTRSGQDRSAGRDLVRYSLEIGFDRRLGVNTNMIFSVYSGTGDYSDDTPDYDEHRIQASFSHRF